MFFDWSLKSWVPFSGYVNTEGDKTNQVLYESNHCNLQSTIGGCHFTRLPYCLLPFPQFPLPRFRVLSREMLCSPSSLNLRACRAGPCCLPWLGIVCVKLGLIWQCSPLEQKLCHPSLLNVSNHFYMGRWVRYSSL